MKALILIDIQQGFEQFEHWGGQRNNPDMETNAANLLSHWRKSGYPVAHIQHASSEAASPLSPASPGFAFKSGFEPKPGEAHFVKSVNSSFVGTGLEQYLRDNGIEDVVICGISTEHCVSTTVRMAGNLGFSVELAHDACHAWPHGSYSAQEVHDTEIAVLDSEFARIAAADEIIKASA